MVHNRAGAEEGEGGARDSELGLRHVGFPKCQNTTSGENSKLREASGNLARLHGRMSAEARSRKPGRGRHNSSSHQKLTAQGQGVAPPQKTRLNASSDAGPHTLKGLKEEPASTTEN